MLRGSPRTRPSSEVRTRADNSEGASRAIPHGAASRKGAFQRALDAGWIELAGDAPREAVEAVLHQVPGLSYADAELVVLARKAGEALFTDETLLARYAEKQGLTVYDVVDAILLLEVLGEIDQAGKRKVVFTIHAEDGRTFTPAELDALGLPGFL